MKVRWKERARNKSSMKVRENREKIEVKTENMVNIPMPKIEKREYEMYELKGVAYKTTDCRLKNNKKVVHHT